jgi:hypothetical protein
VTTKPDKGTFEEGFQTTSVNQNGNETLLQNSGAFLSMYESALKKALGDKSTGDASSGDVRNFV